MVMRMNPESVSDSKKRNPAFITRINKESQDTSYEHMRLEDETRHCRRKKGHPYFSGFNGRRRRLIQL